MTSSSSEPELPSTSGEASDSIAGEGERTDAVNPAGDDTESESKHTLDTDSTDEHPHDKATPSVTDQTSAVALSNPRRLQRDAAVVAVGSSESDENTDVDHNAQPADFRAVPSSGVDTGQPSEGEPSTPHGRLGSAAHPTGSRGDKADASSSPTDSSKSQPSTDATVSTSGESTRRSVGPGVTDASAHRGHKPQIPSVEPTLPRLDQDTGQVSADHGETEDPDLADNAGSKAADEFAAAPSHEDSQAPSSEASTGAPGDDDGAGAVSSTADPIHHDDLVDTEPAGDAAAAPNVKPIGPKPIDTKAKPSAKPPVAGPANWPSGKPVRSASPHAEQLPAEGSPQRDGTAPAGSPKQPRRPQPPTPARPSGSAAGSSVGPRLAWQRIGRGLKTAPTLMGSVAAVLLMAVAWAATVQTQRSSPDQLENLSQPELIGVLSDLDLRSSQLAAEKARLQQARDRLLGSGDQQAVAREQARQRYEALAILAGTVPAAGPGVVVKIDDPDGNVRAPDLVNAVQELRDAGAEAMQINDSRITVSTAFVGPAGQVRVDGRLLTHPITLKAIGDGQTLKTALTFRGGMKATVEKRAGASVDIQAVSKVKVTAVIGDRTARFARPVSTPSIGGS